MADYAGKWLVVHIEERIKLETDAAKNCAYSCPTLEPIGPWGVPIEGPGFASEHTYPVP